MDTSDNPPTSEATMDTTGAYPIVQDEGLGGPGLCIPEQAALIKSILNFLKKAIPDPTFADNIRNCE